MFCPANEAFQNITEKTKLIAQKCSQQIRIATAGSLSPQQHQQQQQQQQHPQSQFYITSQIHDTLEVPNNYDSSQQMSISLPTSPAGFKNFIELENYERNIPRFKLGGSTDTVLNDDSTNIILDDRHNNIREQKNFISELNIHNVNDTTDNCQSSKDKYWKRRTSDTNLEATEKKFLNNGNSIKGTQSLSKAATSKLGYNFNKYFYSCTGGTLRNLARKYTHNKNSSNNSQLATVKWYFKQPTWREWGEEREKDVIYTVYLKKVRYHRPTTVTNQDSDDEISHLEWETVRVRFVKAATLPKLVEALATDDGELDSTFINVFLSTYRTFSNAKEILDLLFKRYDTLTETILQLREKYINSRSCSSALSSNSSHNNSFHLHSSSNGEISSNTHNDIASDDPEDLLSKHEQHKKTLVSALHVWLDGFPEDWNEENLRHLLAFCSKRLPHSELHMKVLHRYERYIRLQAQKNHHHHHYHGCSSSGGTLSGSNNALPWLEQAYPDFTDQFAGLSLAPAFRGPPSHLLQAYQFPHVPVKHFAEQLTRMDMELFKRLIPHQCLGGIWNKRNKHEADTVVATVNQFNAVLHRVVSSILVEAKLKPQERAQYISTWIDIAQELRLLKNFSSLKAIISGLESHPVFRLTKTRNALPKEKHELFSELVGIFEDINRILSLEGTAKYADTVGENDKHIQKAIMKQDLHTSNGTIPYLGSFLSELTYIDTYYPNFIEENLINFSKRRKEFKILAQIKLLQGAANTYNLREDHHFDRWFASMIVLDDRETYALSEQIEPPTETKKANTSTHNNNNNSNLNNNHHSQSASNLIGHRKTDSITSNSSSGAGSHTFLCELNNGSNSISFTESSICSRNNSLDRDTIPPNSSSIISASSSASSFSLESSNSGGQKSTINSTGKTIQNGKISTNGIVTNDGTPIINAQLKQNSGQKNTAPDFYIIRVTLETDSNEESDGVVLYKSIILTNNEHTPQVIKNALVKLDIVADPDDFTIAQVLPDKELVMPPNANVYYAVNTQYNLNFILRRKK